MKLYEGTPSMFWDSVKKQIALRGVSWTWLGERIGKPSSSMSNMRHTWPRLEVEDLRKAAWMIAREIARIEKKGIDFCQHTAEASQRC